MRPTILVVTTWALLTGMVASLPAQSQGTGVRITGRIDDHARVTLVGNTRPEAHVSGNDKGAVLDNFKLDHMLLQLKRSHRSERLLVQFINQLYRPHSPNFHHWLTATEFGQEFGIAGGDLNKVTLWLKSQGLTVNAVQASGMLIDFSGTAGQVAHAFGTPIHYLKVKGIQHIANMRDPQIPAALAPVVAGIVSLHDFHPHGMNRPRPKYTFKAGGYTYETVVPADLATIYNFNPLFKAGISGQGQTIALIEDSNLYTTADWTKFRSTFGLSTYTSGMLTTVHPNTPTSKNDCKNPGTNSDDAEATLDAEWSSAAAPSATIEVASCASTQSTFGGLISLQNLVNAAAPPSIVSMSYGECESYLGAVGNAAYYALYQQAAAEGISVFVSAGDESAASCDAGQWVSFQGISVSGLASTPYNVAVGGTDFGDSYLKENNTYWGSVNSKTYGSALSYVPEIPWNDSCASVLGAMYTTGSPITYGPSGFCNTNYGSNFWEVVGGSGGFSGCAYGATDPNSAAAISGTCAGYAKPAWQTGVLGVPTDGRRDIPDVSLFAGDGTWSHYYIVCWSDTRFGGAACGVTPSKWAGGGGTSFSAPIMAAVQALIEQKTGGKQGNPAPEYYALAAKEYGGAGSSSCNSTLGNATSPACVFYDVTLGDMDTNCTSAADLGINFPDNSGPVNCYMDGEFMGVLSTSNSGYQIAYGATTGWDFATGIGTVNAANLVNAWP